MRTASIDSYINCLGGIRRCSLVRGHTSLWAGLRYRKTGAILFSLPTVYGLKCGLLDIPDDILLLCHHRFQPSGTESPIKHFLLLFSIISFIIIIYIILFIMCMYAFLCVGVCTRVQLPGEARRGHQITGAGVSGRREPTCLPVLGTELWSSA